MPPPVNISGNAGIVDAVLSYDNGGPQTATADLNGDYGFTVPEHWSGTVTPSKTGCTFTPPERTYANLAADMPAEDYVATCVPSTILISGNAGLGGATLNYDNGGPKNSTADVNGDYGFTVPLGWSGSVTPSRTGYTFSPVNRGYSDVAADQTNQDFTASEVPKAPTIAEMHPAENSTACQRPQVGVDLLLTGMVRTAGGSFDPSKVTLKLDGNPVTHLAQITQSGSFPASRASVLYTPPANLDAGLHQVQFLYPSPVGTQTRTWNFTAASIACGTTLTSSPAEPTALDETQPQNSAERILTSAPAEDLSAGGKSIDPVSVSGSESEEAYPQAVTEGSAADAASPIVPAVAISPLSDPVAIQPVIPAGRGSPTGSPTAVRPPGINSLSAISKRPPQRGGLFLFDNLSELPEPTARN